MKLFRKRRNVRNSFKKRDNSKFGFRRLFRVKHKGFRGVLFLVGKIFVCCALLCIIVVSILITILTVYVMKISDGKSELVLDKAMVTDVGHTVVYGYGGDGKKIALSDLFSGGTVMWANLEEIPKSVIDSIVVAEDRTFYAHGGVDFFHTFDAVFNYFLRYHGRRGGSTITQQLIKNLTDERESTGIGGIKRKTREISRALQLEKSYSKDQILEYYLNIIPVGRNLKGVKAAAKYYFNKDIKDVNLEEAVSITIITNRPSYYDPIKYPENNKKRRDKVLRDMFNLGKITEDSMEKAINTPVKTNVGKMPSQKKEKGFQSYYVDAVLNEVVCEYMVNKNITDWNEANRKFLESGYHIYVPMDVEMQNILEALYEKPSTFGWSSFKNKPESAIVVYDLEGNLKAMVGGTGKKEPGDRSTINYATCSRSPGSTFKPLAAYCPAIEENLITYSSFVEDSPIKKVRGEDWPKNYNKKYLMRNISVKEAVEQSLNTVPVRLISDLGVDNVCKFLIDKLKFTTLVAPSSSPKDGIFESLGMGMGALTKGVKLTELTNAYQIFANGGMFTKAKSYEKVVTSGGDNVALSLPFKTTNVISKGSSVVMNRLLRNVVTKGTGRNANLEEVEVIGKTGTSNDDKNLTFVGATPNYVMGIWVGETNRGKIPKDFKSGDLTRIWANIARKVFKNRIQLKSFDLKSVTSEKYCKDSGFLAGSNCKNIEDGYYKTNNLPQKCGFTHAR